MQRFRHPGAPGRASRRDPITAVLVLAVVGLLTIGGTGSTPSGDAAPPPAGRYAHGAAGTARNGFGGEVAPSPTIESWPGTGAGGNGGAFAFIGAQYGSLWSIPPSANNSMGIGYCVMEDVGGEGTVALQPDPAIWDAGELARAAALMASFGGDRVAPYGIDASGAYDVASGEWQQPSLSGGGEYTRRRQVAVGFGVKMMVEDVSPSGVIAGRKLARDTAIINGSGGEFSALRNGYEMAQRMAAVADVQHAVGGVRLEMVWATPDGAAPTVAGTYRLDVRASDSTGKPVGLVPVVQLSEIGIDSNRSVGAVATVNRTGDSADDIARWNAADSTGWPTFDMAGSMAADARFALAANPQGADVTDTAGVARFDVAIPGPDWELAFHTQAPTADADLYSGTGVQGQITWSGPPQSASVHRVVAAPVVGRFVVRKTLDAIDVQGTRDMSGFEFAVQSGGSTIATVTTLTDGRTPPIGAIAGNYRVVETARPEWAAGLLDGGALDVRFDPTGAAPPNTIGAEFVYTNVVPKPSITTRASDAADGDKFLHLQVPGTGTRPDTTTGTRPVAIVDTVSYRGLVPGTAYIARGELVVRDDVCEVPCPTATGETAFVPHSPDGSVEVRLELSDVLADATTRGAVAVVFERIVVAAGGRVVAEHTDPDDLDQTVYFPALTSNLQLADGARSPGPIVDVVHYAGLASGETYRMEMTLHERLADGTCVPTEVRASVEFEPTQASGTVQVRGAELPGPGVFVAFEHLLIGNVLVATHDDCDDVAQTLRFVPPSTTTTTTSTTTVSEPPTSPTTAPPPAATTSTATTASIATTTASTTTILPAPIIAPPRPTSLPRTGSNGARDVGAVAIAMSMIGAGLLVVARRRSGVRES